MISIWCGSNMLKQCHKPSVWESFIQPIKRVIWGGWFIIVLTTLLARENVSPGTWWFPAVFLASLSTVTRCDCIEPGPSDTAPGGVRGRSHATSFSHCVRDLRGFKHRSASRTTKEILQVVHWRSTTRCQKMMGNFPITSSFWAIFSFETNFWASFPTFNLWFTHIGTQLGCVSYERGMGFRDIEDVYPVISPFNYI